MRFRDYLILESFTSNWISSQTTDFLEDYLKTRKGIRQKTKLEIEKELQGRRGINKKDLRIKMKNSLEKITNSLKDDNINSAWNEYRSMANNFQFINQFSNINITRKDEQTKINNLKSKIRSLKFKFDKDRLDSLKEEEKKWVMIVNIDYIKSEMNSIFKSLEKLNEYLNIQKEFKYKGFDIENNYGFKREEYKEALNLLEKSKELIENAGIKDLCNGKISLIGRGPKRHGEIKYDSILSGGQYNVNSGLISLNIDAHKRINDIFTLIHEFGHKYWHTKLSKEKQEEFKLFDSKLDKKKFNYVSDYSKTNVREHWAELFAHYVMFKAKNKIKLEHVKIIENFLH